MAKTTVDVDTVTERIAALRGKVHQVRGGLQTHEAQDLQMEIKRELDALELDLRLPKE